MGYSAQPFAVDIEKVKKAFGSKDQQLLEDVRESRLYEVYADQHEEGLFDKCLVDIIFKYISPENRTKTFSFANLNDITGLNERAGYVYGYAIMAICEVLGNFLTENEGDIFYTGKVFDKTCEFLRSKGFKITMERFWEPMKIFDIPFIEDFPVISMFTKDEIKYLFDELLKTELDENKADPDNDDYDEQTELLVVFRDKLKLCLDKDVEWVSFTH
jgi:hypothetical protein